MQSLPDKSRTNLTKTPSYLSRMAFSVIRIGWDYVAALRFPFLRGPSSKTKQIGILLVQMPFFCTSLILMRASSQRLTAIQKKRNHLVALCFAFVIRLERARLKWAKTI